MLYLTMAQTQGNRSTLQIRHAVRFPHTEHLRPWLVNQVKKHIRDLLFRGSVTRRCVLPRRLLTLVGIVPLLSAVVAASVTGTVLLYGTTSLSLRGGLPIPIGSACPPRTIAAGGIVPSLLSSLTASAASAASPTGTRSPTLTGHENVSLLRVRGSSSVDGPSHKEVGRVLVGITHGLRPWANLIFKRINTF